MGQSERDKPNGLAELQKMYGLDTADSPPPIIGKHTPEMLIVNYPPTYPLELTFDGDKIWQQKYHDPKVRLFTELRFQQLVFDSEWRQSDNKISLNTRRSRHQNSGLIALGIEAAKAMLEQEQLFPENNFLDRIYRTFNYDELYFDDTIIEGRDRFFYIFGLIKIEEIWLPAFINIGTAPTYHAFKQFDMAVLVHA